MVAQLWPPNIAKPKIRETRGIQTRSKQVLIVMVCPCRKQPFEIPTPCVQHIPPPTTLTPATSTSTTSSNTKWFFTNKKKRLGLASLYTGASLHNGACLHQHFQKSKGLFAHGFSLQHILGASLYTGVYLHNGELHTNIFKNRSLSLHMAFFYSTSWGLLFAHLGASLYKGASAIN